MPKKTHDLGVVYYSPIIYHPKKNVSVNTKKKPWMTRKIITSLHHKIRLYRKWKCHKTEEARDRFKKARSTCKKLIRKSHDTYTEALLADGNSPKLWSYIKSKKKDSCSIAPLRDNGVLISDAYGKANILNRQYCSVFNPDNRGCEPSKGENCVSEMPQITISATGVKKILETMNSNKAAGPDMISPVVLKNLADVLMERKILI